MLALNTYIVNQTTNQVKYLLTLDADDASASQIIAKVKHAKNIIVDLGTSTGKINACNRGLNEYAEDWQIVCLASDDMHAIKRGWDSILIKEMRERYPDTDGVLFHSDGYAKKLLNTFCIMGRKYYERFNYIYNPEYISLWSDNEFMQVAALLGKQTYYEQVLFKHLHPANTGQGNDALYQANDKHYYTDKATFNKRKAINFDL